MKVYINDLLKTCYSRKIHKDVPGATILDPLDEDYLCYNCLRVASSRLEGGRLV
jgi:hypothetical protein